MKPDEGTNLKGKYSTIRIWGYNHDARWRQMGSFVDIILQAWVPIIVIFLGKVENNVFYKRKSSIIGLMLFINV